MVVFFSIEEVEEEEEKEEYKSWKKQNRIRKIKSEYQLIYIYMYKVSKLVSIYLYKYLPIIYFEYRKEFKPLGNLFY